MAERKLCIIYIFCNRKNRYKIYGWNTQCTCISVELTTSMDIILMSLLKFFPSKLNGVFKIPTFSNANYRSEVEFLDLMHHEKSLCHTGCVSSYINERDDFIVKFS